MFDNMRSDHNAGGEENPKSPPSRRGSSRAGPTPFHRRKSYFPKDQKKEGRLKWLIYDNEGSFNGWFDWLPLSLRVGYWSPFVVISLVAFYAALFWFKPRPLQFSTFVLEKMGQEDAFAFGIPKASLMDLGIYLWGLVVMVHAKITLGSIGAFPISFTGWSWLLLTGRAGLEFFAWAATAYGNNDLAATLATVGSSIRLVTITNACVVCTIWNFVLLPIIYFKSIPKGEKRRDFMRFNCGFFMTNVHVLNFPLAFAGIMSGDRVRQFTYSDLWVAYFVVVLYSFLYYGVMDRIGLHFYPIFNPRTAFSVISIFCVLGLYYALFKQWNEYLSVP